LLDDDVSKSRSSSRDGISVGSNGLTGEPSFRGKRRAKEEISLRIEERDEPEMADEKSRRRRKEQKSSPVDEGGSVNDLSSCISEGLSVLLRAGTEGEEGRARVGAGGGQLELRLRRLGPQLEFADEKRRTHDGDDLCEILLVGEHEVVELPKEIGSRLSGEGKKWRAREGFSSRSFPLSSLASSSPRSSRKFSPSHW